MRRIFVTLIFFGIVLLLPRPILAQSGWNINSPDNSIQVSLTQNTSGELNFTATKNGATVIETSNLGISSPNAAQTFTQNLTVVNSTTLVINEIYTLPIGKRSTYTNQANQLTLTVGNSSGNTLDVMFRAYNDGIAYRYGANSGITQVSSEASTFNLPDTGTAWYQQPYISNYEREFV
ncbi:MAG: hypothetical protein UV59_C0037G0015 [Candidatus Gottesmanbacteria bacterium GW2011_GWA1_43_11]|uniref:Glycosyl-hydrolase 97 N-terminal domain-containing protein n=1 Tax=Candidatus Gottesmanbacteria bacterium GW2011_GWA1_43_11 TaxID=1618436 RepID=A0A0G1EKF7_9BACT|nr:MAG: hypothetical protein UV59_C0037G0015 [Candidatus Gottesmanbacteria bacterium GW2011_GWA1_43_11]